MKVELIQQTPNPIETIAKIASICYDSDPKNPLGLVKHLYRNGHHSVFEHIYFTFRIDGISRACSHQLVRHRMCSFTQRSQRYCSEDKASFIIPAMVDELDDCEIEWHQEALDRFSDASRFYIDLCDEGVPREDARYFLPNACCTSLYLSCNLRELIHIANERLCSRAQWEIRNVVEEMVQAVDPALRFMLVPKCESGYLICNSPCKKDKEA